MYHALKSVREGKPSVSSAIDIVHLSILCWTRESIKIEVGLCGMLMISCVQYTYSMDIQIYGKPVLAAVAEPVKEITPELLEILDEMVPMLSTHRGVGLAAPQVGILKRIVVIDIGEGPIVMINPTILETSGEQTGEGGIR